MHLELERPDVHKEEDGRKTHTRGNTGRQAVTTTVMDVVSTIARGREKASERGQRAESTVLYNRSVTVLRPDSVRSEAQSPKPKKPTNHTNPAAGRERANYLLPAVLYKTRPTSAIE